MQLGVSLIKGEMSWNSGSSESVVGVYSDARTEYTKQLCVFLVPAYFQFFYQLLEKAKAATTAEPKKSLWQFQTYLNEIPDWNMEKVSGEIATLQGNCGCDYMEDLLTAVFIAHTKVLTAIRVSSKQKKVQITVPKVEHFLFKVLCECSKLLWGSTYLFRDGISSIEKQQNFRAVEGLITEGITQAVRALVPVKSILRDFVAMDEGEEVDEEEKKTGDEETGEEAGGSEEAHAAVPVEETPAAAVPVEETSSGEAAATANEEKKVGGDVSQEIVPAEATVSPPVNEIVTHPTIVVDTRSSVGFADFDTIMDTDNPEGSDMINAPKSGMGENELEILEEEGRALDDDSDVEDLNRTDAEVDDEMISDHASIIGADDYEVLL